MKLSHLRLLWNSIQGQILKNYLKLLPVQKLRGEVPLTVSLTSYGRRVTDTVYFTILSIFHQTSSPKRIVLWLDRINWNENNIPRRLKDLRSKGLEIHFCEDMKSYKKLIPTLHKYPDEIIVTIDDDVIYSPKLLVSLYNSYLKQPNKIHCTRAYRIRFIDGIPNPYKTWNSPEQPKGCTSFLFPVGIGGVLYPPGVLYDDVIKKEIFMKLCPKADDLWFWYMAKLNGTDHVHVKLSPALYSFDAIYQSFHRGSALTHSNVGTNENDIQFINILRAYNFRSLSQGNNSSKV